MRQKPFSLQLRKGTYYSQLFNPTTRKYSSPRSTRTSDYSEACGIAYDWLKNGLPKSRRGRYSETSKFDSERREVADLLSVDAAIATIKSDHFSLDDGQRIIEALKARGIIESAVLTSSSSQELLIPYLKDFWTYDTSPYVREKHLYGQRIGKRHVLESLHRIQYWEKAFSATTLLSDVSIHDLRDFTLKLAEEGRSANTINQIMFAGTTALKWATSHAQLSVDPTKGLMQFSGQSVKRGILTEKEASSLFRIAWKDERARIGNLVAMTTGLRSGEVLALQIEDIGTDRLFIRHSWSAADGLKGTKTNRERIVPLLPQVRTELTNLAKKNPHRGPEEKFIFYGLLPGKPMVPNILLEGLYNALIDIGITEEARQERHICFHSWRHFFTSHMSS
ncbi:MAG: tyrosine-type recombinase/integrase, partial [Rectinemataceae bacterium]|nr:tyrosine-type recombinase/integrase [Rectinemataceae bacterium]